MIEAEDGFLDKIKYNICSRKMLEYGENNVHWTVYDDEPIKTLSLGGLKIFSCSHIVATISYLDGLSVPIKFEIFDSLPSNGQNTVNVILGVEFFENLQKFELKRHELDRYPLRKWFEIRDNDGKAFVPNLAPFVQPLEEEVPFHLEERDISQSSLWCDCARSEDLEFEIDDEQEDSSSNGTICFGPNGISFIPKGLYHTKQEFTAELVDS